MNSEQTIQMGVNRNEDVREGMIDTFGTLISGDRVFLTKVDRG